MKRKLAIALVFTLVACSVVTPNPKPSPDSLEREFRFSESICPFGIDEAVGSIARYPQETLEKLGLGYVAGYSAGQPLIAGIERFEVVWLESTGLARQSNETIARYATERPGSVWLIGNEPDNIYQGNLYPEVYAQAWLSYTSFVESVDPDAVFASGGVTAWTEARQKWWDLAWEAGVKTRPPDVWNTHAYIANEAKPGWGMGMPPGVTTPTQVLSWNERANTNIMRDDLVRMKKWLASKNQTQDIIVTEYGLFGVESYPENFIAQTVLTDSFRIMEELDIDVWLLFSADYDGRFGWEPSPHLINPDTGELTNLGEDWRWFVRREYLGCDSLPVRDILYLPLYVNNDYN